MRKTILAVSVVIFGCSLAFGQPQYKVLWNFAGYWSKDGAYPNGSLIFDAAGNLYGTTQQGGALGQGSVFELSPNPDGTWSENILYSFCPDEEYCYDGSYPSAGLVQDSLGNLYGTTYFGGFGCEVNGDTSCGVVFELSPPSNPGEPWKFSDIHVFCQHSCADGGQPISQLVMDAAENLYGTTGYGGSLHGLGGTVFELSRADAWATTVLYTFCSVGHDYVCPDGQHPEAGVTFDNLGNLYGTTLVGGSATSVGTGTVYKLTPSPQGWTETVLASGRGAFPAAPVRFDPNGNIYGTATGGWRGLPGHDGAVFKLDPKNEYKQSIFKFDFVNGSVPSAELLIDSKRRIAYGTTTRGSNYGNVFQIDSSGKEVELYTFCQLENCDDGLEPSGGLVQDSAGNMYGATFFGGAYGYGVVFEITP